MFAHSAEATEAAMAATVGCDRPRWAKLSPNVGDLVPIVDAAMRGGGEAVTLVNTVTGMAIDPATRRSRLGNAMLSVLIADRALYRLLRRFGVPADFMAGHEDTRSPELGDSCLETDARAQRRLVEHQAQDAPLQLHRRLVPGVLFLQTRRVVQEVAELIRCEVEKIEKVTHGRNLCSSSFDRSQGVSLGAATRREGSHFVCQQHFFQDAAALVNQLVRQRQRRQEA